MIYITFSNSFIGTKKTLEIVLVCSDRLDSISIYSWSHILIKFTTVFAILLALLDDIAQIEQSAGKFTSSDKNIFCFVGIVFGNLHPFEYHRNKNKQQYRKDDSNNHKSDTISSFFLILFFAMCKKKKNDCTNECIHTSNNHQKYHQRQNGQDDILHICISIQGHEQLQKKNKTLQFISFPLFQ